MAIDATFDAAMPMKNLRDHEELHSIVHQKRELLQELRDERHRAENEVHRLNTLISTNEMLVEALSNLAERCAVLDREHDEFLRRDEPREAMNIPAAMYNR